LRPAYYRSFQDWKVYQEGLLTYGIRCTRLSGRVRIDAWPRNARCSQVRQMLCDTLEDPTTGKTRGTSPGRSFAPYMWKLRQIVAMLVTYLILYTCILLEPVIPCQCGQHRRLWVIDDMASATTGSLLRWERVRAGLTQKQLAEKAKLDEVTVNHIENDKRRRPHPRTIHKLAEALGVPVERLLPPSPPSRGYS